MSMWWRTAAGTLKWAATGMPKERFFHTIQAIPREVKGSRMSARDRSQGRIPAVVFSQSYIQKIPGDPTSLVVDSSSVSRKLLFTTEKKQIKTILKSVGLPFFFSSTFLLQVRAGAGSSVLLESGNVLPLKVHTDEEGRILNLVFAWAEEGKELKVDVPIVFKGEDVCPGIQKGGQLNKIRKSIKYLCPVEHIPPKIEVDVSNLDIEDKVLIPDIKVHPTMKLLSKNMEMPVCKVQTIRMPRAEKTDMKPELMPSAGETDMKPELNV